MLSIHFSFSVWSKWNASLWFIGFTWFTNIVIKKVVFYYIFDFFNTYHPKFCWLLVASEYRVCGEFFLNKQVAHFTLNDHLVHNLRFVSNNLSVSLAVSNHNSWNVDEFWTGNLVHTTENTITTITKLLIASQIKNVFGQ